ncbi:hypothetical protein LTR85_008578 [Meristemomyces frigidus]|nr:hypothetical protein LTR85_008578 [Meristemomyces frigidus]
MDVETRWYTSPNITLPRPVLPNNLSMTSHNLQIAHDVGGGRSKLSDYAESSVDNLETVGSSKSMLMESGAFAEDDYDQLQPPMIVRAAAVDEECREDEDPVAAAAIGGGPEALTLTEGGRAMGIQERFVPAPTRGQGQEPASEATRKLSTGRAPLQELNINSLQPLSLPRGSALRTKSEEVEGGQTEDSHIIKSARVEGHKPNVSNKENIKPSRSRSDVGVETMSRSGGIQGVSSHQQLRPPGLSDMQTQHAAKLGVARGSDQLVQKTTWSEDVMFLVLNDGRDSFNSWSRYTAAAKPKDPNIWSVGLLSQPELVCSQGMTNIRTTEAEEEKDVGEPMPMQVLNSTLRLSGALDDSDTVIRPKDRETQPPVARKTSDVLHYFGNAWVVEERPVGARPQGLMEGAVKPTGAAILRDWRWRMDHCCRM